MKKFTIISLVTLTVLGCSATPATNCPKTLTAESPSPTPVKTLAVSSGDEITWPEDMDCRSDIWVQGADIEQEDGYQMFDYNHREVFVRTDRAFYCCELQQICLDHIKGTLPEIVDKCLEWKEYACYAHPHDELAYHGYR